MIDEAEDAAFPRETAQAGMWVFLMSEVMFFGGLFAVFAAYHRLYGAGFDAASRHMDFWIGSSNTAILLMSSLTMALAVQSAREGRRNLLLGLLFATLALGALFLAGKGLEYAHHIRDHLFPGPGFRFDAAHANAAQLFFILYFTMTGLHALHMMAGIGVLAVLLILRWRGKGTAASHTLVEVAGLYWHFVDVVWIFLFPTFYLLGKHG